MFFRLTTESNGNIYFVSICRPIPQELYDPRKMAGALKLTPNGNWIELGRIDQSNIVVNGLILVNYIIYNNYLCEYYYCFDY